MIQRIEQGFKLLEIATWLGFCCQYIAAASSASLFGEPR
jgi:hypothetical protein